MRICWPMLFKMLKYTSRCNIALVILCLGAVLFVWNRCEVKNLEVHFKPRTTSNLARNFAKNRNSNGEIQDENEQLEETVSSEQENRQEREYSDEEGGLNTDHEKDETKNKERSSSYRSIEVLVNGEKRIEGRFEGEEVYIPFSFIKDYFEIDGKIVHDSFGKKFQWRHTTYDYFTPKKDTYDPRGSFMWFVNYNVEGRPRVKCITGVDEVPISTQWGPQGYYYPIQIAQYGLSHYSMMMEGPKNKAPKVVDDCERPGIQEWTTVGKDSHIKNVFDPERKSRVMEFETKDSSQSGVSLPLVSSSKSYVISFDILFKSPGKIVLRLEVDDTKEFTIVYETSANLMMVKKSVVTYGIGKTHGWRHVTRNLLIDMNKAFGERPKRRRKETKKRKLRLTEIQTLTLYGKGYIDNITLAETGHEAAFLASAKWLLKNQDKKGGWPIPVKRKIRGGPELQPGWYSAMAQGQAMSVLTRAYYYTKDMRFLNAARHATGLFHVKSQDHGILAIYMNHYKWYEEYPLTPPLFVLNGFIYSLMGLYDLKMALQSEQREDAEQLFKQGMTSLRAMILMFDSGSGTIYDLRHLSMDHELNLARWDYHATHVNQLTWITQIDSDPFYKKILERWKGYFKGIHANHN